MVILMLASSFAVIGAVSGAETPTSTETRATSSEGRILYVYGNDKMLANEWREYLTNLNYLVDLLPQAGMANAQYSHYNMVIVGTDATTIPFTEIKTMYRSEVSIIGIGNGGGRVSTILGMTPQHFVSGANTQDIIAEDISIYNTPLSVPGVPGTVQLYSEPASNIFLLMRAQRDANSTLFLGNWSANTSYSPIVQINSYMYYGFIQSPKVLTSAGDAFLQNVIYYMNSRHNYNIPIPRMTSRINFDGQYSYLFEWYGARFIYVDHTGKNYTGMFEDESYIYIYINILKTDDTDYLSIHFEKNNSRMLMPQKSTFYVILSESKGGVKYREFNASTGNWDAFKNPDGTNIDAAWNFGTQYYTAEIKISKAYMGLNKGSEQLLGFGIQYTNVTNYPSTLSWSNPSTYLTAYSQNHWKGQYEEISTPSSYRAPVVDGVISSPEWNGASQYYLQDSVGHPVYVNSMVVGSYLYLGGYIANISGRISTIWFYFDPNGNGGSEPQTDDFRFRGSKQSDDTFTYQESHGTGSGWASEEPLTNATMKMTMWRDYVYYELKIPLNILGITPGTFKDVHMRVRSYVNGSGYNVPFESSYVKPDGWTLLLTSPSAWGSDPMTFDAHNGTAVTLDGVKSSGEWDDAFPYYYSVSGTTKYISMYTKTYNEALYIYLHYSNPVDKTEDTLVELGFDVDYDHDGTPRDGDFVIEVNYLGQAREWYPGSTYWNETNPSGWSFAIDNSSSGWSVEIMIPYEKLNLTPGDDKDVGMVLYFTDGSSISQNQPVFSSWWDTSTWNRITSSDNWGGSIEVPEFSSGIIAMMLIAVFAVVAVVARKRR